MTRAVARKQLRARLNDITLERRVSAFTASAQGAVTNTTLIDSTLIEADNFWNGAWIRFTSGSNNNDTREISAFTASNDTLTWIDPAKLRTESADTFDLFEIGRFSDLDLEDYLHQGTMEFIKNVSSLLVDDPDKLALIFGDNTETESITEDATDTGIYDIPTTGIPMVYLSIRSGTDVEVRRTSTTMKGRLLESNNIYKASATDPYYWFENDKIHLAPKAVGTLAMQFIDEPNKPASDSTEYDINDRYMEAVLKYAEFLAWSSVGDQRSRGAFQIFQNSVNTTTGIPINES